jgi:transcriptional regulator with XRE-family HTH domain
MMPEYLRQYRLSTGRNLRQFGEYIGVTGAAVSAWECGRNPLPKWLVNHIDTLKRLENLESPVLPIPAVPGLCACGCGGFTEINHRNDSGKRWVRGEYRHFLKGHNASFQRKAAP